MPLKKSTTKLSVNLNAVAMLRNRRNLPWPDLFETGWTVLQSGANGITVHPRPDERHIRASDCHQLAQLTTRDFKRRELNMEGYPDARFLALVEAVKPDQATLVPDDPAQNTSDHGWDIPANKAMLEEVIASLKAQGVRVSLFIDADPSIPAHAAAVGADRVELYTGPYGGADDPEVRAAELDKLVATAEAAREAGLGINAGHDLTLFNLPALLKRIPFIEEVSIGHAFTADCLVHGMRETVRLYRRACGFIV